MQRTRLVHHLGELSVLGGSRRALCWSPTGTVDLVQRAEHRDNRDANPTPSTAAPARPSRATLAQPSQTNSKATGLGLRLSMNGCIRIGRTP